MHTRDIQVGRHVVTVDFFQFTPKDRSMCNHVPCNAPEGWKTAVLIQPRSARIPPQIAIFDGEWWYLFRYSPLGFNYFAVLSLRGFRNPAEMFEFEVERFWNKRLLA